MVGLGQSLEGLGDNDVGRVSWALHGQVFPSIFSTCKSSRVSGTETRDNDST